jgi:predicted DNA-binding transcriptional regulator AlpA
VARQRTERLYSLAEVAEKTGISLASLRRYRAMHAERVPSHGKGRAQRFPAAALPVFQELKAEGLARRGRGSAGKRGTRGRRGETSTAAAGDRAQLLTLVEIGRRTGISYPTLLRYVRLYQDRLPHVGSGRKRRFRPAALEEFKKLREQSRRGRRAGTDATAIAPSVARQLAKLERGQRDLSRQLRDLRKELLRPVRIRLER